MADILCFSRNRCTSVEQMDEKTMRSSCRLQDTLTDAFVEVMVKIPDLEVGGVRGKVGRSVGGGEIDVAEALKKVIGVRVGPGAGANDADGHARHVHAAVLPVRVRVGALLARQQRPGNPAASVDQPKTREGEVRETRCTT